MAKKIGGPVNRPIKRPTVKKNNTAKNLQQNRELGLKQDLSEAKAAQVDDARQHVKTDKDKELKKPTEKVTLSTPDVNKAKESEKPKAEAENKVEDSAPQVQEQAQGPKAKTALDFGEEFGDNLKDMPEGERKEIMSKGQTAIAQIAEGGTEVEPMSALAAVSFNHAQEALKKKMPGASLKDIRAAASKDPEIAKNVKLLDSSRNYLLELRKEKAEAGAGGEAQTASGAGGNGAVPPNGGDGSSAVAGPPSDGSTGPIQGDGSISHKSPEEQARLFQGQSAQGPQGAQQGEPPFYHKSPEEQAALVKERNEQMNAIMQMWSEMMAENRKAMAARHKLMMETNIEILQTFQSIHISRARASQQHHDLYVKLITESWG